MPTKARKLIALGVVLTLIGLIGGVVATTTSESAWPLKWLFMPIYAVGALCLIGGGILWLKDLKS